MARWIAGLLWYLLASLIGAAVAVLGSLAILAIGDSVAVRPAGHDPAQNWAHGLAYIVIPILAAPIGAVVGIISLAICQIIKRRQHGLSH